MAEILRGAARLMLALAAAMSLAATGAAAQDVPRWIVDHAHSQLTFDTAAEGVAFTGRFPDWDADIRFDPKQLDKSKVVVTVQTGTALTGDASRDQTAYSPDWFAAAMFPKATFTTQSIMDLGGGKYEATGDLTIRGVTLSVDFPFTLSITGDQVDVVGQTVVDRSKFGVGQGDYGTAEVVPFEVTVKVALSAKLAK